MDTQKETPGTEAPEFSGIATAITLLALAITIYLAIWQIDWDGSVIAPVGFCLVISGLAGGITNALLSRR